MKLIENEKNEIREAYNEYKRIYPKYQKIKRIVNTQSVAGLAKRYGVPRAKIKGVLGRHAVHAWKDGKQVWYRFNDEQLSVLSSRQRQVLELRLQGYTLNEVGKMFGITSERVRQVQNKAILRIVGS